MKSDVCSTSPLQDETNMACTVTIEDVQSIGNPLQKIIIFGTATECKPLVINKPSIVTVTINCSNTEDITKNASVQVDGTWNIEFDQLKRCRCGDELTINAFCSSDPDCKAPPWIDKIDCITCPVIDFNDGGDDVGGPQQVICAPNGQVHVKIHFHVTNPSINDIVVSVNCGPGGIPILGGPITVPAGTDVFVSNVICSYDPNVTPIATPFIEFFNTDLSPLGCPSIPILVPSLAECEDICPDDVIIQVKDSLSSVVVPDNVVCLSGGSYEVEVIYPLPSPDISYFWEIDDVSQTTQVPPEKIDVLVTQNNTTKVDVIITKSGCIPKGREVSLVGCNTDCNQDIAIEVKNSNGQIINNLNNCLPAGDYTITVTAPISPQWDYTWIIDGTLDNFNSTSVYQISIAADQVVSVVITASAPGCLQKAMNISLTGCKDTDDDDDDDDDDDNSSCFDSLSSFISCLGNFICAILYILLLLGIIAFITQVILAFCPFPPNVTLIYTAGITLAAILVLMLLLVLCSWSWCRFLRALVWIFEWTAIFCLVFFFICLNAAILIAAFSFGLVAGLLFLINPSCGWPNLLELP